MGVYLNGKMVSTAMPLSTGDTSSPAIDSKISAHNSDTNAHSILFSALNTRIQNLENGGGCLVTSVNSKKGDVQLTAEDVGAVSTAMLNAAITNALAQAKESGDFKGDKGDKGETGLQGPTGATGTRGSTWSTSDGGAPSMTGSELKGDMLLDKSNGDVYTANVETMDWEKIMNIKGPKGDKGDSSSGSSITVNGSVSGTVKTTKIFDFTYNSNVLTTNADPFDIYDALDMGYDIKARLVIEGGEFPPFLLSCTSVYNTGNGYIIGFATTGISNKALLNFSILFNGSNWSLSIYDSSDNPVTSTDITDALGYTPFNPKNIDSTLSSTSINPVQNKVINAALNERLLASAAATSANKLTTPRTINVSEGAEGPGVSFDGSQNVAIPINSFKEKYLSWGGRSIAGDISPVDAGMSYLHNANRAQFANPKGIIVEYSTDGGTTWVDYGTSDNYKVRLVSGLSPTFYLGKRASGTGAASDALRVTINAADCSIYTKLKTVLIEVATGGHVGLQAKVEKAMRGSETKFISTIDTYVVTGWSGWNSLGLNIGPFGGSQNQTSNIGALRFTFTYSGTPESNQRAAILNMMFLGTTSWTTPSNMAKTGHIYNWDANQNVAFPAQVTATQFNGKATSAGSADTATNVSVTNATAAVSRHVWFSDSNTETKRAYNDSFKYNPSGNIASVNISGNAATATKATQDGSGNVIATTYATQTWVTSQIQSAVDATWEASY